MIEFCKCGSILIHGNCTNKSCKEHKKSLVDEVTYSQIEYIKSLFKRLGEEPDVDFEILSKKEASILISKLLERLDEEE